ncbi:kinase-like domain-containing protein [Rhizophagus diaphanus]|nr:kinase-like domain-containing protein [Rhizophagus diaphanus] [Rhizophagus sp. MUCL 43196]
MMVMQYADEGNLRNILSINFNNILWREKIIYLYWSAMDLKYLHELGYFHGYFHSGIILRIEGSSYISDFGLSGPSNEQKPDSKIYGVLPYIAPEVLNGEPYRLSSDIYSFGIVMAELSSGKPPFHKRKHDNGLALEICNGLRPEFGEGTPEIYKKLAHRCMNANPNQRPTANELYVILGCWYNFCDNVKYGYEGEEVKSVFKEADKEIPNISTSYEKKPDAIYTIEHLLSVICCQDSKLVDLEVPS